MNPAFVPAERQLVVEITVSDIKRSLEVYSALGFTIIRTEPHFAEVGWENAKLLLEERPGYQGPLDTPAGNVRILVPDVDRYWLLCNELGLEVFAPLEDRYYGLRDFTVLDPDRFGLRFASEISRAGHS